MTPDAAEQLELTDWRRRVAEIYARWRHESASDPEGATLHLRAARDALFRSHPQSPLPPSQRGDYPGVRYWPYDPAYRIVGLVEPVEAQPAPAPAIQLPTSGTGPFSIRKIGQLRLGGPFGGAVLPVFWMEGYAGGVFLPFRDATSGSETYGAGRYLLDTVKGADLGGDHERREIMLDFNLAYHPSCAYDPKWNCPLAPPESRLSVPVPVGERLP